jgi:outer membrane biosynthesis protein TonB
MRYLKYLTEDAVSKALDIPEPDVGGKYPDEKVKRYIQIIDAGIKAMTKRDESEANDAIVADLRDKKSKWKNVKKETKPTKTKLELPPDQEEEPQEEPPPPQDQEEPPIKPPPNESELLKFLSKKML